MVVMAGRLLCWLHVVKIMAEKLTVMTMMAGTVGRERECEEIDDRKGKILGRKAVFS